VRSRSRYSALTYQRCTLESNRQETSKAVLGPNGPSGRWKSGGLPKNCARVIPTGGLFGKKLSPASSGLPLVE